MKSKAVRLLTITLTLLALTACTQKVEPQPRQEALAFKNAYEELNNVAVDESRVYRELNIPEDNPMIETSANELLTKMDNKESFYIYFGDEMCPWCRLSLPSALEAAKENKIDTIYYVQIWNENHEEVLRDKYVLDEEGNAKIDKTGTEDYYKLLEKLDSLLSDYNLSDGEGNQVPTGEKRVYAPNYVHIVNGDPVELTTGTSDAIKNPWGEVTQDQQTEMKNMMTAFFLAK